MLKKSPMKMLRFALLLSSQTWSFSDAVKLAHLRRDEHGLFPNKMDTDRLGLNEIEPPSADATRPLHVQTPHPVLRLPSCDVPAAPVAARKPAALVRSRNLSFRSAHNKSHSKCSHLGRSVDDQLEFLLQLNQVPFLSEMHPLAWTLLDKAYGDIGTAQRDQIQEMAKFPVVFFVTIESDPSFARGLCEQGLTVLDFSPDLRVSSMLVRDSPKQQLKSLKAMHVAQTKFQMAIKLLNRNVSNVFTEMDVFWLKDPMPHFLNAPGLKEAPHFVLGVHDDNPFLPNIGVWWVSGNAPASLRRFFEVALEIMENTHASVHDQVVVSRLLAHRVRGPQLGMHVFGDGSPYPIPWRCADERDPGTKGLCLAIEQLKSWDDINMRILDSHLIASTPYPHYDRQTLAVHVLSRAPLQAADAKVVLAKAVGIYKGSSSYREKIKTDYRYIGWDGIAHGKSLQHGFCFTSCVFGRMFPVLLKLGLSTGRRVVLPSELDRSGFLWPGEMMFDIPKYEQELKAHTIHGPVVLESSFLANEWLAVKHMFPVARVRIDSAGWGAVQRVASKGSPPSTSYWSFCDTDGDDSCSMPSIFATLVNHTHVQTAKTVLISFPTAFRFGTKKLTDNDVVIGNSLFEIAPDCNDRMDYKRFICDRDQARSDFVSSNGGENTAVYLKDHEAHDPLGAAHLCVK